ncbi:predicted protein [Naegleria gruberi]|uniref:Predicted protein n=1 Tax=Naegleria gruberi TaxID=5762 RepID=D2V3U1_NAEGR|nr:uncharacterized protein NAEGRDRAFT_63488 [Naegleria gruberi]EFC48254.1 predicted protein [Naegleria gruberi]|eukprot:XP_002680998.1 predicted protein [Naegleria gruberi strain NEG-M]
MFDKPSNLCSQSFDIEKQVCFSNSSDTDVVDLFWIDYSGAEVFISTIAPKQQVGQKTFATHPFLMRSLLSRKIVGLFVIDEQLPDRSTLKYGENNYNTSGNSKSSGGMIPTPGDAPPRLFEKITYRNSIVGSQDQYYGLKSATGTWPAELHVKNRTGHNLESYWIDFEGNLRSYGILDSGKNFDSMSGHGHIFLFKTPDGSYQKIITASSEKPSQFLDPDEIEITASVIDSPSETSCHSILEKHIQGRCGRALKFFTEPHIDRIISEIETKLKQEGKRFIDEDFFPGDNWKRASDYFKNQASIFKGDISPKAPIQGGAGDCWLIQSMSGAATLPDKIKEVFCKCEHIDPSLGLFVLSFHSTDGSKIFILLDDYFQFTSTNFKCSRSSTVGELWVPLIEKAFAKLCGSFESLHPVVGNHGINPAEVLLYLLSGKNGKNIQWYSAEGKTIISQGKFYPLVESLLDSKKSVPVCTSNANTKEGYVDEYGIVHYHGYSMLGYRKYPQHGINLLHIRNTWSKQEWNGLWSDNCVQWAKYPDIASELRSVSEDGCFWISYDDFVNHFCVLWWNEF